MAQRPSLFAIDVCRQGRGPSSYWTRVTVQKKGSGLQLGTLWTIHSLKTFLRNIQFLLLRSQEASVRGGVTVSYPDIFVFLFFRQRAFVYILEVR